MYDAWVSGAVTGIGNGHGMGRRYIGYIGIRAAVSTGTKPFTDTPAHFCGVKRNNRFYRLVNLTTLHVVSVKTSGGIVCQILQT